MNTFLFAFNAVMPIVVLIALGWFLKKIGLFTKPFLDTGNRFAFRVLISTLLYYNIYSIDSLGSIDFRFVGYCMIAIVIIAVLALAVYLPFTKDKAQRGALIQSMFRSNFSIIGLPLATSLFGQEGAAAASVLSAFIIPLFNILAVVVLTVFAPDNGEKKKVSIFGILKGIITNPLIIAALLGIATLGVRALFVKLNVSFRLTDVKFLYSSIKSISACATPFALIILGGRFEFSAVKRLAKPIALGTVMRTVVVPAVTLSIAYFFVPGLTGAHFAAYVAAFGSPVAVSSAIMAKEMNSDAELAGQLVVWTSIVSVFTVFITTVIFRSLGIF